jgi:hypothetical protein
MSEYEKNNFTPSSKAAAAGGYCVDDNDDEEDEAEFDPNNDDSNFSSDDDYDDDDEKDENGEASATIVILSGSLTCSEEKHVIYSGTWHLLGCEDSMNATANTFKLKSNQKFTTFDLSNPTLGGKAHTLLFHGFYATNKSEEGDEQQSKMKEKDVEITFTDVSEESVSSPKNASKDHKTTSESLNTTSTKLFYVYGKGSNEYGPFRIKGEYKVYCEGSEAGIRSTNVTQEGEKMSRNTLVCEKTYIVRPRHRTKRSRHSDYLSDEDDYDSDDYGGGADLEELAALHEEACMSVEELHRRYYVGSHENEGPPSDDDKKPAAANRNIGEEEDVDRKPSAKERKTGYYEEDLKPPAKKKNRQQLKNEESDDEYTF